MPQYNHTKVLMDVENMGIQASALRPDDNITVYVENTGKLSTLQNLRASTGSSTEHSDFVDVSLGMQQVSEMASVLGGAAGAMSVTSTTSFLFTVVPCVAVSLSAEEESRRDSSPLAIEIAQTPRVCEANPAAVEVPIEDVIVVDDERMIVRIVERLLHRIGVDHVDCMDDGAELLDVLLRRHHKPQCILLDITMPRSDGVIVCQAIRKHEELQHIPIYAMTANIEGHDLFRDSGFSGLLGKPLNRRALKDVLRHCSAVQQCKNNGEPPPPFGVFGSAKTI
jgi:CheY-like chemotaxis protein